jgi:Arc/MetJ family transcription regulator
MYICIKEIIMRKNIDIDEMLLTKLKILSVFENNSVKGLMEEAVRWFVAQKEKQRLAELSSEEKEDLGLMLLMQQADRADVASRKEIMDILDQ